MFLSKSSEGLEKSELRWYFGQVLFKEGVLAVGEVTGSLPLP